MEKRNAFVAAAVFPLDQIEPLLERAAEKTELEEVRPLIAEALEQMSALREMHHAAIELQRLTMTKIATVANFDFTRHSACHLELVARVRHLAGVKNLRHGTVRGGTVS